MVSVRRTRIERRISRFARLIGHRLGPVFPELQENMVVGARSEDSRLAGPISCTILKSDFTARSPVTREIVAALRAIDSPRPRSVLRIRRHSVCLADPLGRPHVQLFEPATICSTVYFLLVVPRLLPLADVGVPGAKNTSGAGPGSPVSTTSVALIRGPHPYWKYLPQQMARAHTTNSCCFGNSPFVSLGYHRQES